MQLRLRLCMREERSNTMWKIPYVLQMEDDSADENYYLIDNSEVEDVQIFRSRGAALLALRQKAEAIDCYVAMNEDGGTIVAFAFDPS
jgi:hypothetical protein